MRKLGGIFAFFGGLLWLLVPAAVIRGWIESGFGEHGLSGALFASDLWRNLLFCFLPLACASAMLISGFRGRGRPARIVSPFHLWLALSVVICAVQRLMPGYSALAADFPLPGGRESAPLIRFAAENGAPIFLSLALLFSLLALFLRSGGKKSRR